MTDVSLEELGPVDYLVVEFPAGASNFNLAWPALRNFEYFRGAQNRRSEEMSYYWIDETQKPNKS